ncbi:MAG: aminotransferase class III-fold pyridoxal phosphate-dependent enzyme, partial [Gammaproteobacteria bacterium]|nr:aminotransferase class III-fold pyridoxal phosphate-dependent enzyme [Gammaproteobacteria bacterium]
MIAVRLARMYTGRDKIVLHAGSYHGKWETTICATRGPPFGNTNVRGIPQGVKEDVIIIPWNNLESVEEAFQTGEVSTIILQGNSLFTKQYAEGLRKLTKQYGVVFMMDEVVSGFKYAVGGAQEYYGVTPDLTILGKIIGGGAPVGAVCGKKEIMEYHSFKDDFWNKFIRISVGGTWNAQPLSIVGGVEVMKMIDKKRDKIYPRLRLIGKRLTKNFKDLAEDSEVSAVTINLPYEDPVAFSINFLNRPVPPEKEYLWRTGPTSFEDYNIRAGFSTGSETNRATYLSMINNGISALRGRSFVLCTKHDDEDMTMTETAFEVTINLLKEMG